MNPAWHYGIVFIGGGIGSALRYGAGRVSIAVIGPDYPAGTLFVNVVGCFLMGALVALLAYRDIGIDQSVKLFLVTGMLGGFTTFSAFALDAVALWERGDALTAGSYVLVSVIGSIAGLVAGLAIVRTAVS
jgi:fluoride exporter